MDTEFSVKNLIKIGKVFSIVDVQIVVESIKSMPPLDLDTYLFDSEAKPIGQIFDVFGPITEPLYSIKFTDEQQIKDKNIHKDMPVYFLPQADNQTITKFAFVNEIRKKYKPSDASWENDQEPPDSEMDFSDDEEERQRRKAKR